VPGIEDARASAQTGGPAPRWRPLEPEARDLRLLRRSRLAVVAAEALDLVEVTRVGLARQRRGPGSQNCAAESSVNGVTLLQPARAALPMMVVGLLRFWSLVRYGPRQRYWLAMCSHDQEKGDMPRVSSAAVSYSR
jgi:hypothetical protein